MHVRQAVTARAPLGVADSRRLPDHAAVEQAATGLG
jgi:hypothetical protein